VEQTHHRSRRFWPTYSYRCITKQLQRGEWVVNKRVQRLMDIQAQIRPKKRCTTNSAHGFPPLSEPGPRLGDRATRAGLGVRHHLLRYGFVYLAVIMDVFTRGIGGWHLGRNLDHTSTLAALQRALVEYPAPEIHHSDQGIQCVATAYTERLIRTIKEVSMKKASLTDRLRYAFDNLMSKGTVALIGWLALVTLVVTLVVALVATRVVSEISFVEQVWAYLMMTLQAETMVDLGWPLRLAGLIVTLTGLFVTSILVGLLATAIDSKLTNLRKGRSRVIETGHTVILGWSEQVFSVVSELLVANENQPRSCIVTLGDKDKVEMEDEIRDQVGDTGSTRIVCRRGSPMEVTDLRIVSLQAAKSIIVLSPEGEESDYSVIKTLLAIVNSPDRRPEPYHVVTEIHDPRNVEVARMVGRDELEVVFTGELVARITAQTCRQSGLSVVYTELMNFAGDEIYFQEEPGLVGKKFGEALLAYEDSTVLGLRFGTGGLKLNPPMDTRIRQGDQVIAISEDDDTVVLSGRQDLGINEAAVQMTRPAELAPEHVLILGWNHRAPTIISELDHYVAPGSLITVVSECDDGEAEVSRCRAGAQHQTVVYLHGDITDRRTLDQLVLAAETAVDHVILLSYSGLFDAQQADARTLVTLLHLRDIASRLERPFSIVSEMMDIRNRELAEVARADDFVVSDKLISLILSQISENKELGAVFSDLFDPEGAEVYLKPAADYVKLDEPLNFYTVVESARRRGEVALGYRLHAHADDVTKAYGVVLNPDKSAPLAFTEQDRVVVLAET
jgi:voltage-gated potassium channel Kch